MILLSIKIVIWLSVVKLYATADRWPVWLGLTVAVVFTFIDQLGYEWNWMLAAIFSANWSFASATLWAFGRFESVLARITIIGLGSFALILGPFLIPYPLR